LGTAPQSCNPEYTLTSPERLPQLQGDVRVSREPHLQAPGIKTVYIFLSAGRTDFVNSRDSDRPSASGQGTPDHGRADFSRCWRACFEGASGEAHLSPGHVGTVDRGHRLHHREIIDEF